MSQDVRTHRSASDFPNAPQLNQQDDRERAEAEATGAIPLGGRCANAGPESITVDGYANYLMDDLFGDLERALEGSLQLPTAPLSSTEIVSLKRLSLAELSLPPVVPPAQAWPLAQPTLPTAPHLTPPSLTTKRQSRRRWPRRLYRLFLGLGFASLLAVLGAWSLQPENRQQVRSWLSAIAPSPAPPAVEPPPVANPDVEFSRYLQRALAMIEQQPRSGLPPGLPVAPPPMPTGINILPPLGSPLGAPPTTASNTPGGDRVYVPIYPTSQLPTANVPTSVPLPAQIPDVPTVPLAVPLAANSPPPAAAPPTASHPSPVASAVKYTLVGVLELGDRSTALFESNGVARRISIGESIGSSGWSLVEVNNQEAIIRRNGEVRSIYVGQSF